MGFDIVGTEVYSYVHHSMLLNVSKADNTSSTSPNSKQQRWLE